MTADFSVEGKRIVVTGAARGNGRAIADGFLRAGCTVYYVDILPVEELPADGVAAGRALNVQLNILDNAAVRDFFSTLPSLDVLVNNAGIARAYAEDDEYWADTMSVNLEAAYWCMQMAAKKMRAGNTNGSIINVTSISAHVGSRGNPAYHASKGGLRMLSKGLAADFGLDGIRVNCICPGYIITDMTRRSFEDDDRRQMIENKTMLGRWGQSEDLVGICLFLSSSASAYITGADIPVDGGMINGGIL